MSFFESIQFLQLFLMILYWWGADLLVHSSLHAMNLRLDLDFDCYLANAGYQHSSSVERFSLTLQG